MLPQRACKLTYGRPAASCNALLREIEAVHPLCFTTSAGAGPSGSPIGAAW